MGFNSCDDGTLYTTPNGYKLKLCYSGSTINNVGKVKEIFLKNAYCQSLEPSLKCSNQIFADEYRLKKVFFGSNGDWVVCPSGSESWCQGSVKINKSNTSKVTLSLSEDGKNKINIG